MPALVRGKLIMRMAQGIEEHIEVLAAIEAADVGKPFR
jgi:acyl-CoA reductase-like NAD-dependent aldehyde dehydrogenase